MNESGAREPRRLLRPEVIIAAAGIAVGVSAGVAIRGSGPLPTSLFLGGCLFVLVALAGLGALGAALRHRAWAARSLAAFAGGAVIAAAVAYPIAPSYRSPGADLEHRGSGTVRLDMPSAIDWHGKTTCRRRQQDSAVSTVFMPDVRIDDRWAAVLLRFDTSATPGQAELTLSFISPTEGSTDYRASSGAGLDPTLVAADRLSGSMRFAAMRLPGQGRSPDPVRDRLTGAFGWACEPSPSG